MLTAVCVCAAIIAFDSAFNYLRMADRKGDLFYGGRSLIDLATVAGLIYVIATLNRGS